MGPQGGPRCEVVPFEERNYWLQARLRTSTALPTSVRSSSVSFRDVLEPTASRGSMSDERLLGHDVRMLAEYWALARSNAASLSPRVVSASRTRCTVASACSTSASVSDMSRHDSAFSFPGSDQEGRATYGGDA